MACESSARANSASSAAVILGSGLGFAGAGLGGAGFGFATGFGFTAGLGAGLALGFGFGFGFGFTAGLGAFLGFKSLASTNLAFITLGAGFTFTTLLSCEAQFTVSAKSINACKTRVANAGRRIIRGALGLA